MLLLNSGTAVELALAYGTWRQGTLSLPGERLCVGVCLPKLGTWPAIFQVAAVLSARYWDKNQW